MTGNQEARKVAKGETSVWSAECPAWRGLTAPVDNGLPDLLLLAFALAAPAEPLAVAAVDARDDDEASVREVVAALEVDGVRVTVEVTAQEMRGAGGGGSRSANRLGANTGGQRALNSKRTRKTAGESSGEGRPFSLLSMGPVAWVT